MHVPFSLDVAGRPVLVVGDGDRRRAQGGGRSPTPAPIVTRLAPSRLPPPATPPGTGS